MNIQHIEKSYTGLMYLAVGITGFIAGLVVAFVLFSGGGGGNQPVFGQIEQEQDYEAIKMSVFNGPYAEVLNATQDAANKTEGVMIDQYYQSVSNQILGEGGSQ